jgi:hypothetical protein
VTRKTARQAVGYLARAQMLDRPQESAQMAEIIGQNMCSSRIDFPFVPALIDVASLLATIIAMR